MNRYLDGVPINVSTIPTEIGLITNLKEFYFDSMSEILERGTIPSEIGNCRELTDVYIDSQITGSIPTELGLLTKLSTLILGVSEVLTSGLNFGTEVLTSVPPEEGKVGGVLTPGVLSGSEVEGTKALAFVPASATCCFRST